MTWRNLYKSSFEDSESSENRKISLLISLTLFSRAIAVRVFSYAKKEGRDTAKINYNDYKLNCLSTDFLCFCFCVLTIIKIKKY